MTAGLSKGREGQTGRTTWLAPVAAAFALGAVWLGHASAVRAEGRICDVPLADWQPRQVLIDKLAAEGWTDIAVRIDDGCYKVRALGADGRPLRALYDPARLEPVKLPLHHDDDDGHHGYERHGDGPYAE